MEAIATIHSTFPARGTSLVETVNKLCVEFSAIQKELQVAKSENDKLKNELDRCRSQYDTLPSVDPSSLRRSVAYYCHPDRGGSTDLMSKLNVIFDFISAIDCPQAEIHDIKKEGAAR